VSAISNSGVLATPAVLLDGHRVPPAGTWSALMEEWVGVESR
jgi:hypothetical protein